MNVKAHAKAVLMGEIEELGKQNQEVTKHVIS